MDVEALAGADVGRLRRQHALGLVQVVRRRHFEVRLVAGDEANGKPGALGDRGVVGEVAAGGGAMGVEDLPVMKSLRRLRAPELGAVEGLDDAALGAALHRVLERQRRNGARRLGQRLEHAVDGGAVEKRPRPVMDQHALGRQPGEALEAEPHRILPRRAARHRRQQVEAPGSCVIRARHRRG